MNSRILERIKEKDNSIIKHFWNFKTLASYFFVKRLKLMFVCLLYAVQHFLNGTLHISVLYCYVLFIHTYFFISVGRMYNNGVLDTISTRPCTGTLYRHENSLVLVFRSLCNQRFLPSVYLFPMCQPPIFIDLESPVISFWTKGRRQKSGTFSGALR